MKVNIFYKRHRERTEIDVISGQKGSIISWLACHNLEIDWRIEEVKIERCLEQYEK